MAAIGSGRRPSSADPLARASRIILEAKESFEGALMASAAAGDYVVDVKRDRLVIFASTLGTVFESRRSKSHPHAEVRMFRTLRTEHGGGG